MCDADGSATVGGPDCLVVPSSDLEMAARRHPWSPVAIRALVGAIERSPCLAVLMSSATAPNAAAWRGVLDGMGEHGRGRTLQQLRAKWKVLKMAFHGEREHRLVRGCPSLHPPIHYRRLRRMWDAAGRPDYRDRHYTAAMRRGAVPAMRRHVRRRQRAQAVQEEEEEEEEEEEDETEHEEEQEEAADVEVLSPGSSPAPVAGASTSGAVSPPAASGASTASRPASPPAYVASSPDSVGAPLVISSGSSPTMGQGDHATTDAPVAAAEDAVEVPAAAEDVGGAAPVPGEALDAGAPAPAAFSPATSPLRVPEETAELLLRRANARIRALEEEVRHIRERWQEDIGTMARQRRLDSEVIQMQDRQLQVQHQNMTQLLELSRAQRACLRDMRRINITLQDQIHR